MKYDRWIADRLDHRIPAGRLKDPYGRDRRDGLHPAICFIGMKACVEARYAAEIGDTSRLALPAPRPYISPAAGVFPGCVAP